MSLSFWIGMIIKKALQFLQDASTYKQLNRNIINAAESKNKKIYKTINRFRNDNLTLVNQLTT